MSQLLEILASQITPSHMQQLGASIGADNDQMQRAVAAALPMLVSGLAKNANSSPKGAASLASALDRDHGGDLLGSLGSLLGGGGGGSAAGLGGLLGAAASMLGGGDQGRRATDGAGILGHIFGSRQGAVTNGVAKASGLDANAVGQLLATLAPIVMSSLGDAKQKQGLDAGGLASMLNQEQSSLASHGGGILEAILDKDHDGSISDDIAQVGLEYAGKQIFGSLFGK